MICKTGILFLMFILLSACAAPENGGRAVQETDEPVYNEVMETLGITEDNSRLCSFLRLSAGEEAVYLFRPYKNVSTWRGILRA